MPEQEAKKQLLTELGAYRELAEMIDTVMAGVPAQYRVEVFKALMARMSIKQTLGGLVELPFQFADAMEQRRRSRLDGDRT